MYANGNIYGSTFSKYGNIVRGGPQIYLVFYSGTNISGEIQDLELSNSYRRRESEIHFIEITFLFKKIC